jgi:heme/copper-type cytochrome/quinol oxidase subunit 2
MNKYIIIGVILVGIVAGGMIFSAKTDTDNCTAGMGEDRDITVVSKRLEWRFEPEDISVNKCDRVHIKVINEDNFDHGFAIDALGISQRLPASGAIDINFVASKAGEFPFYCSVSCSTSENPSFNLKDGKVESGPYMGKIRGHFDHLGKFIVSEVKKLIN